ncbi:hypothetical protein [Actinomadura chokoriensis]|uniref:DUF4190 domain-containing protein n=1 Tax=Actinomadura chokoriensis TaxID=454156 RepID=A0ABV4QZQ2_9ACTN
MSGYGGTPPGWQDPYGGQGWSQTPYSGAQPPPGYPYAYGPPGVPVRPTSNASTTACLVCNIASVLLCCGVLAVPGAIVSAIAMGRVHNDPESARKLTIAGWILFGLSVVCGIVIAVIYFIFLLNADSGYESGTGI